MASTVLALWKHVCEEYVVASFKLLDAELFVHF